MKKLKFSMLFAFLAIYSLTIAQVAVNIDGSTPNSKAMLDIESSTMGLLIPRMTTTQRNTLEGNIGTSEKGMIVFDSDLDHFYYYDGVGFIKMSAGVISLLEDADGDTKIEVERTADEDTIRFSVGNTERFKMSGKGRLEVLGTYSIYIGEKAGGPNYINEYYNTAIGYRSMFSNIGGTWNTALGYKSLNLNTTGVRNTAIGHVSLKSNTEGNENTSVGNNSLYSNTIGSNNTAIGYYSLFNNQGDGNTAIGSHALSENTGAIRNTAIGFNALRENTSGIVNTAIGAGALEYATGNYNIAIGETAGYNITSGHSNIIIGRGLPAPSATGDQQLYIGSIIYGDMSNGNIGFGTTTPGGKLHLKSSASILSIIETTNGDADLHIKGTTGDPCVAFYDNGIYGGSVGYSNAGDYMFLYDGGTLAFKDGELGVGTVTPEEKLHVYSSGSVTAIIESGSGDASLNIKATGTNDPDVAFYDNGVFGGSIGYSNAGDYLFLYEGGTLAFKNGNLGIGGVLDPQCALQIDGQIWPLTHKGGTIGKTTLAWGNIYGDNFINVGAAAFTDRSVTDEILMFPPKAKKEGDFDYMTEKGLEELAPSSLPSVLEKEGGILMDEMTSYNYKANYEQQVQIEELKRLVEQLITQNKNLEDKIKIIEKANPLHGNQH